MQAEIDQLVEHKLQPFNVRWCPSTQRARACRLVSYVYSAQLFDVKLCNVKGGDSCISFNELESTLGGGKVGCIAPAALCRSRAREPSHALFLTRCLVQTVMQDLKESVARCLQVQWCDA